MFFILPAGTLDSATQAGTIPSPSPTALAGGTNPTVTPKTIN